MSTPANLLSGPPGSAAVQPVSGTVAISGELANYREVAFTPALDAGNAYASGDVLWINTVITGSQRSADAKGWLVGMEIGDEDDQTAAQLEVYFFSSATASLGTINVAPAITDADSRTILGKVVILSTDWIDLGGVKVANKVPTDIGFPLLMIPASGTANVYCAAITRGSPTQTASGIKVRFFFKDEI